MATWHQMRNPVKLYNDTEWSVVTDSVNGQGVMRFTTKDQAEIYMANVTKHNPDIRAYILPPCKEPKK